MCLSGRRFFRHLGNLTHVRPNGPPSCDVLGTVDLPPDSEQALVSAVR